MRKVITLLPLIALTGCAIFSKTATQEQKQAEVHDLAYAAASLGGQLALMQNPEYRPAFELAYNDLNQMVESKVITGLLLRNIIASLPVKELTSPQARLAIETATMLYDSRVGDRMNIENQPYVVAAATGIRDGLKVALGK